MIMASPFATLRSTV